jgi:hypothetical protein
MTKRPPVTDYQFSQKNLKKVQTNFLTEEKYHLRSSVEAKLNTRQIKELSNIKH